MLVGQPFLPPPSRPSPVEPKPTGVVDGPDRGIAVDSVFRGAVHLNRCRQLEVRALGLDTGKYLRSFGGGQGFEGGVTFSSCDSCKFFEDIEEGRGGEE